MNILLFGATGMVGRGVLLEALRSDDVSHVRVVGRAPTGLTDPKLSEMICDDLVDLAPIEEHLAGFDACLYCLGASAAGMDEAAYSRINHDMPLAAARCVVRLNPHSTFCYVSGAGTGSQPAMWRVSSDVPRWT